MRTQSTLGALAAVLAVLVAGCGGSDDSEGESASGGLFVQNAETGELTERGDGMFAIRLEGVPTTTWFTDRPERKSGTETLAEFVKGWSEGSGSFADDPPNAVLEFEQDGELRILPVELTGARLGSGTLRYDARELDGAPAFYPRGEAKRAEPGRFDRAALFIDDASGGVCQIEWEIPSENGANTGIKVDDGGTIALSPSRDQDVFRILTNAAQAGASRIHVASKLVYVSGNVAGYDIQLATAVTFNPGSTTIDGSLIGSGDKPSAEAGIGCDVQLSENQYGQWSFKATR